MPLLRCGRFEQPQRLADSDWGGELTAGRIGGQRVTVTFTYSLVKKSPSLPRACSTYSPGSLNVARTAHRLSGGSGGGAQRRADAEPPRWSSHVLNCGGSRVTRPGLRKITHDIRRP